MAAFQFFFVRPPGAAPGKMPPCAAADVAYTYICHWTPLCKGEILTKIMVFYHKCHKTHPKV